MKQELAFKNVRVRYLLVWFGIGILVPLFLPISISIEGLNDASVAGIFMMYVYGIIATWIVWVIWKRKISITVLFRPVPWRSLPWHLIVAVLGFSVALSVFTGSLIMYLWPEYQVDNETADLLSATTVGLVVFSILAPLVEELLYRGIMIGSWSARWGMRKAIIVSSSLFAIAHLEFIGSFVFAIIMSLLYIHTRSLTVPIAIHIANNTLIALFVMLLPSADSSILSTQEVVWGMGISATVALLLLIPTSRFLKRYWPAKSV